MTLWRLQALIILAFLLVCWGMASLPTVRVTPKLKEMCDAPNPDETARRLCAELSAS